MRYLELAVEDAVGDDAGLVKYLIRDDRRF